jgi:hypothetical protein
MVPRCLEFEEEQETEPEPPATSKGKSSSEPKRRRGEHGRHKKSNEVHVITELGPSGEPLQPTEVIGKYSNQCGCLVKDRVSILYDDWREVPKGDKEWVWNEMKKRFLYPNNADMVKAESHVYYLAGKALRNFKYMLNRDYLAKGKTPYVKYNMILPEVWEEFRRKRETPEARAKSEVFTRLAKKNEHHHHMGMIGYAGHKPTWRAEEAARREAGEEDPYDDLDERSRDFLYGRRPKKLKEGMKKFNRPKIEEAEKAIVELTMAKNSGKIEIRKGQDVLTFALGNPEHRGRVRGMSSRKSWKSVECWQSDANTYHSRQRYKEGLRQEGRDEALREMISTQITHMFTSDDPKVVEQRNQMFRQAGILVTPAQGQFAVPMIGVPQRYPVDDITQMTRCRLYVPYGRSGKKKFVANGVAFPRDDPSLSYLEGRIDAKHAVVQILSVVPGAEDIELEEPHPSSMTTLGEAVYSDVHWVKEDIELEMDIELEEPTVAPTSSQPIGTSTSQLKVTPSPNPYPDDGGGDGDDEGGDDDEGNKCGPSSSPPPHSQSPPTPSHEMRGNEVPTGEKPMPTPLQSPQEEETPPYTKGLQPVTPKLGQNAASGEQTPPPPQDDPSGRRCPPTPKKQDLICEEPLKLAYTTEWERYGWSPHNSQQTIPCY